MTDRELKARLRTHSEKMKSSVASPFDIKYVIRAKESCEMKRNTERNHLFKKILYSAAGLAASFVIAVNCIPSLAYAASDVPILGDVVRVVTFGRFEVREENYEAKIVTPKIEGLLNKELEEKLNNEFKENADAVIAAFEKDVKLLSEEFGDKNFHLGIDANYVIRTDNDDILVLDCYMSDTVASSSTTHKFYTIEKKTGRLLELRHLFKEGTDYVNPISDYILEEMRKQNADGSGFFWIDEGDIANFEKIKKDQNFFINDDDNIVICFDKYEVAAGAQGCPEFEIPRDVVKDILK